MKSKADFESLVFEKAEKMKADGINRRRFIYAAASAAAVFVLVFGLAFGAKIVDLVKTFDDNGMYGIAVESGENNDQADDGLNQPEGEEYDGDFWGVDGVNGDFTVSEEYMTSFAEDIYESVEEDGAAPDEEGIPGNGGDDFFGEDDDDELNGDFLKEIGSPSSRIIYSSEDGKSVSVDSEKEAKEIYGSIWELELIYGTNSERLTPVGVMDIVETDSQRAERRVTLEIYEECIVVKNEGSSSGEMYAVSDDFKNVMRKYFDVDFMTDNHD